MITFIKPSGAVVQVDENSASTAKALGWKEKTEPPKQDDKKHYKAK